MFSVLSKRNSNILEIKINPTLGTETNANNIGNSKPRIWMEAKISDKRLPKASGKNKHSIIKLYRRATLILLKKNFYVHNFLLVLIEYSLCFTIAILCFK
jgi:hypothetical protein